MIINLFLSIFQFSLISSIIIILLIIFIPFFNKRYSGKNYTTRTIPARTTLFIPCTYSAYFMVASVTKQFTAFAIMILYDKGLLQLNEKANLYLPPNMQLPSEITVHYFLSHMLGLHNNYNFEDGFYVDGDRKPYDKEQFFRNWITRKPIKKPGKEFEYNNSNYN